MAELENKLLAVREARENIPYSMASRIAQANLSFAAPSLAAHFRSRISSALLFAPSCPPLAVVRDGQQEEQPVEQPSSPSQENLFGSHHSKGNSSGSLINLSSVPFSAVERMLANYVEIHLPQYPCVPESLLQSIVDVVRNKDLGAINPTSIDGNAATTGPGLGHYEYCILFIVLAISAMTLTWRADHQARAASESFFSSATKHLQALQGQDPIQFLQISLLLAHYAHMCPERADNWPSIANAVRIVLDLGLHKGCPQALGQEEARRRCQLFWVTYGMERSLCTNLRLPLSFPEESITTQVCIHPRSVNRRRLAHSAAGFSHG